MTEEFNIAPIARAIAAELGPDWSVAEFDNDRWMSRAELARRDGLAVFMRYDSWKKRVNVSPSVPAWDGRARSLWDFGALGYGQKGPGCTFDPKRPAKAVAGDIRRKVVEPYAPMLEIVRAKIAEREADANKAIATWRRISEILGASVNDDNQRSLDEARPIYLYDTGPAKVRGKIVCQSYGRVDLDLSSLEPAQAIALAQAIATLPAA